MTAAVDVVRSVYARFAVGDLAGFLELCAEDIAWVVNGPADLEKCRTFHGHEGVGRFLDILGRTWAFESFAPHEFHADGDTVIVLGEETGRDTASNEPFANRWVHVFDLADGKISCFREFLCHWRGAEEPPPMAWNGA